MVQVPTEAAVTETTPVQTPAVAVKPNKKAKRKAAQAAAATTVPADPATPPVEGAPAAPAVEKPKGEHGIFRSKDLPWSAKKIAVLSTLKKLGAVSLTSCKGVKEVVAAATADGLELKAVNVRHYCYHAAAGELVEVVEHPEGVTGHGFYLTPAGVAVDYAAELAKLNAPTPVMEAAATTVPLDLVVAAQ